MKVLGMSVGLTAMFGLGMLWVVFYLVPLVAYLMDTVGKTFQFQ